MKALNAAKQKLSNLETQLMTLKQHLSAINQQYTKLLDEKKTVLNQVKRLEAENTEIKVTDHALVRYLERVKGFDIEAVRNEILSEETIGLIREFDGNGTFPCNGYRVVLVDNSVVTVMD